MDGLLQASKSLTKQKVRITAAGTLPCSPITFVEPLHPASTSLQSREVSPDFYTTFPKNLSL